MTLRAQRLPLSLRVSVTDRCQLRCLYCMPPDGVTKLPRREIVSFEEITRLVDLLQSQFGLSKVHITGGDPLLRSDIVDLVRILAARNLEDLALTTNAQLLADMATDLKRAGLRRLNISLDTLDVDTYRSLTRGGDLDRALDGLKAALRSGFHPVKLNMLVLKGVNDHEVTSMVRFAMIHGCQVRFLELMPIGTGAEHFDEWSVSSAEVRASLSECFDLRPTPVRAGSSSRTYLARNGSGRAAEIGFISSHTAPFCEGCRRLRLTTDGRLLGCLARQEGFNIRSLLQTNKPRSASQLAKIVDEALRLKKKGRDFAGQGLMVRIGG